MENDINVIILLRHIRIPGIRIYVSNSSYYFQNEMIYQIPTPES